MPLTRRPKTNVSIVELRSKNMRAIKSRDTKPEMVLRRALHREGLRYRLHVPTLPGKPDMVFQKHRAAIEIRGCFWLGHTCQDGHLPKSNINYWSPKLARNKERDLTNLRRLRAKGYRVKVIWECQLATEAKIAKKTASILNWLMRIPC